MNLQSDTSSSNSSSCSWAVISEGGSQDETNPKVCSVCGSEIRGIYFYRPSCELCILCDSCQGLNLSGFPGCTHNQPRTRFQSAKFNENEQDAADPTEQCPIVPGPLISDYSEPIEPVPSIEPDESASCTDSVHKEPSLSIPNTVEKSTVGPEDRSICIGDGTRSLTEHIIEALQHSSPPIAIPGSFSTMMPHTRVATSQRLKYSPPSLSFQSASSSLPRSNSPSPVSFSRPLDIPSSFTEARKSSLSESPGPTSSSSSSSSSPPSSARSGRSGAMEFLKSVVLHSTAALNNFDLIPFGTLDRGEDYPIKSDSLVSNTTNAASEIGFKTHQAANPIVAHAKLWDSDRLSTLIKPRAVPKAVSEAAAYNLR